MAKLYVVGIGPGGLNHMTLEARDALAAAEVIVGYQTYLDFITPLIKGKEVFSSGMMKEVERCRQAISSAGSGRDTAIVSSGDAGIYGMAGLILELLDSEVPPLTKEGMGGGAVPQQSKSPCIHLYQGGMWRSKSSSSPVSLLSRRRLRCSAHR